MLDVSRIVSGKLRLEMRPLNLIDVVDTCGEAIRPIAESRGLAIQVSKPDEAVVVTGDAARLQQVILNLLSNAVKFTPAGGRLELIASASATEACVTVRDTGIGIDSDFLPHVFDRFRQGNAETTTGLGLGLAIVKNLVELHRRNRRRGERGHRPRRTIHDYPAAAGLAGAAPGAPFTSQPRTPRVPEQTLAMPPSFTLYFRTVI